MGGSYLELEKRYQAYGKALHKDGGGLRLRDSVHRSQSGWFARIRAQGYEPMPATASARASSTRVGVRSCGRTTAGPAAGKTT